MTRLRRWGLRRQYPRSGSPEGSGAGRRAVAARCPSSRSPDRREPDRKARRSRSGAPRRGGRQSGASDPRATAGRVIPAARPPDRVPGRSGLPEPRGIRCAARVTAPRLTDAWKASKQKVQTKVLAEIGPTAADLSAAQELRDKVRSTVNEIFEREDLGISPIERQRFVEEILEDSLGYGPLEALLADNSITEIMCNAYDELWIERKGLIERCEGVRVRHTEPVPPDHRPHGPRSGPAGRRVLAHGRRPARRRLPDQRHCAPVGASRSRAHHPEVPERAFLMQDLLNLGTLGALDAAVFLEACVRGKVSMVVVGGTGTGKTTMLNVLSNFIPDGERLITIEESAELQIQGAHVVTLGAPGQCGGNGRGPHPRPGAQLP